MTKGLIRGLFNFRVLFAFAFILIVLAFNKNQTEKPKYSIYQVYRTDFNSVFSSIDVLFEQVITDPHGNETYDQFLQLRLDFKKIAFLLEYVNKDWYDKLNGSPTIKIEFEEYTGNSIPPSGLQVLESLLIERAPMDQILNSLLTLRYELQEYEQYLTQVKLSKSQMIESILLNLVRIETLSLGGFDHQGKDQRFEEIQYELTALKKLVKEYFINDQTEVIDEHFSQLFKLILKKKQGVNIYYSTIVRDGIIPLRAAILEGFENTLKDVDDWQNLPINLKKSSLYQKDFIDPNFYAKHGSTIGKKKMQALGKTLFFDPLLSRNLDLSCASCHDPKNYFIENPNTKDGIPGLDKMRNVPSLINASFQTRLMYDLREQFLEDQLDHVINAEHEFNFSMSEIASRLEMSEEYKQMFVEAFPDASTSEVISAFSISQAIASYVRELTALESSFDQYINKRKDNIAVGVLEGFDIFMDKGNCASCHFPPIFNGLLPPYYMETESEVLSIPREGWKEDFVLNDDLGRYNFENIEEFKHSFKTTTVRNAEFTAPYMHNGSISNLDDLVDFYNKGGGSGFGFAHEHQTLSEDSLGLNEKEKMALISFIESLSDSTSYDRTEIIAFPKIDQRPEWNDRGNKY